MALTRQQKESVLAGLEQIMGTKPTLFLVDFMRAKTLDVTAFKAGLRKLGARYVVVKKTLLKRVFDRHGIAFPSWEQYRGSMGIVFTSGNEIDVAKAVQKFVKDNAAKIKAKDALQILGGFMDKVFLARPQVVMLAQIPPREVLLGQIVNVIASPLSGLVYALNYNIQNFVMTVKAVAGSRK